MLSASPRRLGSLALLHQRLVQYVRTAGPSRRMIQQQPEDYAREGKRVPVAHALVEERDCHEHRPEVRREQREVHRGGGGAVLQQRRDQDVEGGEREREADGQPDQRRAVARGEPFAHAAQGVRHRRALEHAALHERDQGAVAAQPREVLHPVATAAD
eukprot:CAMPEP_0205857822 /NCGR_PEP_ID=MMETSP1083-20121108/3868_1 /ASSEMBLY_ACC=CAM_ASM_000430 /TAXON_ID=97485 /ORGANISM="Prymnesium parvum, Strain Texoma1" /LENGTH=157 /DNA_ID=CAMNT_0053219339 /DNA_START=242 /DNA_END=712 /DNA_ORIENTATION=-